MVFASIRLAGVATLAVTFFQTTTAHTQSIRLGDLFGHGKLTGTGGVNTISGVTGGGLTPWALIGGNETDDQIGGSAYYSHAFLRDFNLDTYGGSIDFFDRLEVSYGRQTFGFGKTGQALDNKITGALGVTYDQLPPTLQFGKDFSLAQDIVAAKLKLFGNAVYAQGSWLPQISIGYEFHHNENGSTIRAIGSKPNGHEFYIAATKIWVNGLLGRTTLINANLRFTNAVQNGLLGYGGVNGKDGYHVLPEFAAAWFVTHNIAIGSEYRFMPHFQQVGYNDLGNSWSANDDWKDIFIAWFPTKWLSLTGAYVDLGRVGTFKRQNGAYLSISGSF